MSKPYSAACERNQGPILEVLQRHFADRRRVLEIGSGTGQHAIHFAAALPQLQWQPSDRADRLPGIRAWMEECPAPNLLAPLALDVNGPWPACEYDAVFSANTLHIMSWEEVQQLFRHLPQVTVPGAKLIIYGPFRLGGLHTSASNAAFDAMLRAQAPHQGVRDAEAVDALAVAAGFHLLEDSPMPANNRCRIWQRDPVAPSQS